MEPIPIHFIRIPETSSALAEAAVAVTSIELNIEELIKKEIIFLALMLNEMPDEVKQFSIINEEIEEEEDTETIKNIYELYFNQYYELTKSFTTSSTLGLASIVPYVDDSASAAAVDVVPATVVDESILDKIRKKYNIAIQMFKGINEEFKKTHKKEIFRAMCGSGLGLDAWSYIPSLLSMIKIIRGNLLFLI